jgi:hypothetical protein
MSFKLPQSHTLRQIIGAAGGMAVAAVVYTGFQAMSSVQLNRAMLVDLNPTVSENAGEVVVNDKNIDADTLKRLQSRAQQVAKQQQEAYDNPPAETETVEPATEIEQHAQERLDARKTMLAQLTATTHVVPANTYVTDKQRLQMRAERALGIQQGQSVVTAQFDSQAQLREAVAGDNVAADFVEDAHAGADLAAQTDVQPMPDFITPPPTTRLPNSGLGLNMIALLTMVLAVTVRYKHQIRNRLQVALAGIRAV